MIKGCTKRVVVVKDVQSDIFEEAYFILRPKSEKSKAKASRTDIITEANRLVLDNPGSSESPGITLCKEQKIARLIRDFLFFVSGAALSLGGYAVMMVLQ